MVNYTIGEEQFVPRYTTESFSFFFVHARHTLGKNLCTAETTTTTTMTQSNTTARTLSASIFAVYVRDRMKTPSIALSLGGELDGGVFRSSPLHCNVTENLVRIFLGCVLFGGEISTENSDTGLGQLLEVIEKTSNIGRMLKIICSFFT